MFEKNNPVLISMPRTGSTVTGKMLYNISHHRYGSKNYLNQLTTVVPQYHAEFERRDGVIQQVTYRREKSGFITWIWVEVVVPPLAQNVEKGQAVDEDQEGLSTVVIFGQIMQDLEKTSHFWWD